MRIYFYTLGCKVNQYEAQEMAELLEKRGHTIIYNVADADKSSSVTELVRKSAGYKGYHSCGNSA